MKPAREQFMIRALANIKRTGRTVIGVFPDAEEVDAINRSFTYTVGNALKGFPELLIIGIHDETGCDIINSLSATMIERRKAFADGEQYTFAGMSCPVAFVEAAESVKQDYTIQVEQILGPIPYRVLQVVLSDKQGKLPWEAGCEKPYSEVRVLRRLQ